MIASDQVWFTWFLICFCFCCWRFVRLNTLQFKKSPPKVPYKAIALAIFLFLIGSLLIIFGALLLSGAIKVEVSLAVCCCILWTDGIIVGVQLKVSPVYKLKHHFFFGCQKAHYQVCHTPIFFRFEVTDNNNLSGLFHQCTSPENPFLPLPRRLYFRPCWFVFFFFFCLWAGYFQKLSDRFFRNLADGWTIDLDWIPDPANFLKDS